MLDFCSQNGITLDFTVPYTPEQNGCAERFNRTSIEKVRCLITYSNVPKDLWDEATLAACYMINRSPTSSVSADATPAELWFKEKPNVKNMKVFGCSVFYHIPKELRIKLDNKAQKGVFVGYAPTGYRVLY